MVADPPAAPRDDDLRAALTVDIDAVEAEHGGACGPQPQAAATPEPRAIGPAEAAALEQEGGGPAAKRARMAST